MNQQQEHPILSALRSALFLLPGVAAALAMCFALQRGPGELEGIPELLPLPKAAAVEEVEKTAAPSEDMELLTAKDEPDLEQAEGHYPDGVYTGSARGYGGTVTVQVTVQGGQITEVTIRSASGETDAFFNRAMGVVPQVLQRQIWEVDTVSGATYSSRGILGAVENALTGAEVENETPPPQPEPEPIQEDSFQEPSAYQDGTYTGTAQGFGGDITVEVTIREGKLSRIRIVSASGESSSYLNRAEAVISRVLGNGSPNVDTVSGATYSSNGILNAVKRALSKAAADSDGKEPSQTPEKKPSATPRYKLTDGTYTGTGEGFGGDITVQVVVKKGLISKVKILDAAGETASFFNRAKQLCNSIVTAQSAQIDGISGATYSSRGILQGAGEAIDKAAGRWKDPSEEDAAGQETGQSEDTTPKYKDGVYTATGWCVDEWETFRYELTVSVTVEQGRIVSVQVVPGEDQSDDPSMNDSFYTRAVSGYQDRTGVQVQGIPDRIVAAQDTEGVDAVSRATYTSKTILSLAQEALAPALIITQEPDPEPQPEPDPDPDPEPDPVQPETDRPARIHADQYQDGTYTASGWCSDEWETFLYELSVSITVEQGRIVSVQFAPGEDRSDYPEENDYYYSRAESGYTKSSGVTVDGVPAQVVSAQGTEGIDGVSGATYSSDTMIDLCSKALSAAAAETAKSEPEKTVQPSETTAVQTKPMLAAVFEPETTAVQGEDAVLPPEQAEPEAAADSEDKIAETDCTETQAESAAPEEETKALPEQPIEQSPKEDDPEPNPEDENLSESQITESEPEEMPQEESNEQEEP